MGISEYREIVAECRRLEKDIEGFEESLKQAKVEKDRIETEYSQKINSIVDDRDRYIEDKINTKTYECNNELLDKKRCLEDDLNLLIKEVEPSYAEEVYEFYRDYVEAIKKFKAGLNEVQCIYKEILRIIPVKEIKVSEVKGIDAIYDKLDKEIERVAEFSIKNKTDHVKVGRALGSLLGAAIYLPKNSRLGMYIMLAVIIGIVIYINPLIILIASSLSIVLHFINKSRDNRILLETLSNISYLACLIAEMESQTKSKMRALIASKKSKYSEDYNKRKLELEKEINSIEDVISDNVITVRENIKEESDSTEFEEKQHRELQIIYEKKLCDAENRVHMLEEEFNDNKDEYAIKIEERERGKKELDEQYFSLTRCGDLKIMPEQFLLGYDGYEPITLEMHNYSSHIICTTNKQSSIYTSFVNMCITQILCSVNPSCVKIYVVDIENGTSRFGLFGSLESMGIVRIIETESELKKLIDDVYQIRSDRDKTVTPYRDTLNKYNEMMIENYGLTLPYHVIITTHHETLLITDDKYRQLLTSGSMGIVTINMWSKKLFDYDKERDAEFYSKLSKMLEIIVKTSEYNEERDTNLSSLSTDGLIVPMKRSEVEAKRKDLLLNVKNNRGR